ncbi:MAG: aldose 1-epimerase [Hyphomicrobiaceae bacterium]|nr:aldose 1-epimerase [Hyphomicrobiaceae bacterium]
MTDVIELNDGRLRLAVFPQGGAAITRFQWKSSSGQWVDLMRQATEEGIARREPLLMSCFPLVPYCDLVTGGGFRFAGVRYDLPRNHPQIADPIHGEGWINAWKVVGTTASDITLALEHTTEDEGFPFAYTAKLSLSLKNNMLTVDISVTNDGKVPMPAGIGIHPYYRRTADTLVRAGCARVWPADAVKHQTAAMPVPPEWDFRALRGFGDVNLDHSFAWWDNRYDIEWPSDRTRLTVTAGPVFRNLLIFVPHRGDHFCLEPISNAMDAFNLADLGIEGHGVSVIQPGHSLTGSVVFVPGDLAA